MAGPIRAGSIRAGPVGQNTGRAPGFDPRDSVDPPHSANLAVLGKKYRVTYGNQIVFYSKFFSSYTVYAATQKFRHPGTHINLIT